MTKEQEDKIGPVDLFHTLRRRKMSLERFLESEGINDLEGWDEWISLNRGTFSVSQDLYSIVDEMLSSTHTAIVNNLGSSPTPPTPLEANSIVLTSPQKEQENSQEGEGHPLSITPDESPMEDVTVEKATKGRKEKK